MPAILLEPEVRYAPTAEVRLLESDSGIGKIGGPAIVYNEWSEDLGGFVERALPGLADESLKLDDIICCENHDDQLLLGRNTSGTLQLIPGAFALEYDCDLPDTSYARDLKVKIQRSDIRGNSFRFRTIADRWGTIDGKEYRELVKIKLIDVSPVTMPAYPQTSVALRALFERAEMDWDALYRSLLKTAGEHQEQRDIDVITDAIKFLSGYLPLAPEGRSQDSGDELQGQLVALRAKLEIASRM